MDPAVPRVAGEGFAVVIVTAAPTAVIIITDIGPAADAIAIIAATIDVGDLHPAAVTLGRASTGVHRSLRTTITVTVIVAAVSAAIAALGRASRRERVWPYEDRSVGAVALKKKTSSMPA